MMNLDWFQPTKRGCDSIGVIYIVIMNLPRQECLKPENVIIVGIIPGPKKPKIHKNPFLQPLVSDLVDLWDGVLLNINGKHEMLDNSKRTSVTPIFYFISGFLLV